MQDVAKEAPQQFQEAINRAKEGAAAQAAAAIPAVDPVTGLPTPPPAGPPKAPTATHVAGVRIEVGKSKQKLRSAQAKLSAKWKKYHNTARTGTRIFMGVLIPILISSTFSGAGTQSGFFVSAWRREKMTLTGQKSPSIPLTSSTRMACFVVVLTIQDGTANR